MLKMRLRNLRLTFRVFGPLDKPPFNRQRVLSLSRGFWHAAPQRVYAEYGNVILFTLFAQNPGNP